MKVRLITPHPGARNPWACNPRIGTIHITASLPFATRGPGLYIHRVRSAHVNLWDGAYQETVFKFWCGACGFQSIRKGTRSVQLTAEPPENGVFCATCEGRATGAGQLSSHDIAGRFVMFAPRTGVLA